MAPTPDVVNPATGALHISPLPLHPTTTTTTTARVVSPARSNQGLGGDALAHVRAMMEGCAVCARYPLRNSANDPVPSPSPSALAMAKEEQFDVDEKRRDLFTLLKNLAKLAWEEALGLVGRLLAAAVTPGSPPALPEGGQALGAGAQHTPPANGHGPGVAVRGVQWQDVELAVTLLYEIGEAAPAEEGGPSLGTNKMGGQSDKTEGPLAGLVAALSQAVAAAGGQDRLGVAGGGAMSPPLPASTHRLVALAVMEVCVRYSRVLQQAPALLPGVALAFLDARGMGHASEDVSTRACYLFSRLCKTLRAQMRPFLGSLLPALQPHLARVATTPLADTPTGQVGRDTSAKALAPATAVVDDRLYVFEAVGLMLGQEEVRGWGGGGSWEAEGMGLG